MGDEVILTGVVKIPVKTDPKVVSLIKNYTNGLKYIVHEILKHPEKYGVFKFSKEEKRIKWEQSIKQIHRDFYEHIKQKFNLPPRITLSCLREASFIVKTVINNPKNKDRKCIIKTYRAKIDGYSYRLIEDKGDFVSIKIYGFGEIEIEGFPREWLARYLDWYQGGATLRMEKGKIIFLMTLKKRVRIPTVSERCIAVDLNFEEIVVGNFEGVIRIKTPTKRIMHIKKNHIEKTQKKYNKQWRHVKRIRKAISRWWKRIHDINDNFAKRASLSIVKLAERLGYNTIVLEDLNGLRDEQAKLNKPWRERFTFFAYRRLQFWIEWQGLKHGIAVVYVNPSNTSKTCPYCGEKLKETKVKRMLKCEKCRKIMDRDNVAVRNLIKKFKIEMSRLRGTGNGAEEM